MWGRHSHDLPSTSPLSYSDEPSPRCDIRSSPTDSHPSPPTEVYPSENLKSEKDNNDPPCGSRTGTTSLHTVAFKEQPQPPYPSGSSTVTSDANRLSEEIGTESRGHTVHSRLRQFWVESFTSGRSRTKSENQTPTGPSPRSDSLRVRPTGRTSPTSNYGRDVLPEHAYTVTGGSNQAASLLRRLALYTTVSGAQSEQSSVRSGGDYSKHHGQPSPTTPLNGASVGPFGSAPIPPSLSLLLHTNRSGGDKQRRQKSPRSMIGRLVSLNSSSQRSFEDIYGLPDPSKLPKEEPVSTLEFTGARLKNPKKISQKLQVKSGLDALRRRRAGSLSSGAAAPVSGSGGGDRRSLIGAPSTGNRPFLLDHISKSEETLMSFPNAVGWRTPALILSPHCTISGVNDCGPSPNQPVSFRPSIRPHLSSAANHHHHQHHHHHHHHHHHQHRRAGHGHHRSRLYLGHHGQHYTRVTESRRYLMFTRSLPFWSTKQYLETHGTGLGEAETYAVLLHHTPCYDLIPDSAKLVILDSQLTITKAFKALIYNGIRAAPVWDSSTQSFSSMLTVTDFVNMLHLFWSGTPVNVSNSGPILDLGDFDNLTIQKWKEYVRTDPSIKSATQPRVSFCETFTSSNSVTTTTVKDNLASKPGFSRAEPCDLSLTSSCPASNPSSPTRSRSTSSSASSSSRSSTTSLPPDLSTVPTSKSHSSVSPPTVPTSESISGYLRSSLPGLLSRRPNTPYFRLLTASPEDALFKALRLLSRFRLHHLPVLDCSYQRTGNVLYVLTQSRILLYLYSRLPHLPQPRFLQSSIADLNVGTFGHIAMVTLSSTLREAVTLFARDHVSSLPVVDTLENRRLINVFSKYDVITLIMSGAYNNPELTIREWLEVCKVSQSTSPNENRTKPPVELCLATNNLLCVMEKLVKTSFRRLVIVNNLTEYRVDGVVTLSDVLRFAVIQQARMVNLHAQPPSVAEVPDECDDAENVRQNQSPKVESSMKQLDKATTGTGKQKTVKVRLSSPPRSSPSPSRIRTYSNQSIKENGKSLSREHMDASPHNTFTSNVMFEESALSSA